MKLEKMAEKNSQLTDLEQVAITEFELDFEERNATIEETTGILQKVQPLEYDNWILLLYRNERKWSEMI